MTLNSNRFSAAVPKRAAVYEHPWRSAARPASDLPAFSAGMFAACAAVGWMASAVRFAAGLLIGMAVAQLAQAQMDVGAETQLRARTQAAVDNTPRAISDPAADSLIVQARDALRRKDRARLAVLSTAAADAGHPLAMWPQYWELLNRIGEVQQNEVSAFEARWSGTYVEDRFRNDWLLELGRRQDWVNFQAEYPRFRMNDDREVSCYALLTEYQSGKDVRLAALSTWIAQRDADTGCALLASTLVDAKQLGHADLWRKLRTTADANRPRAARQAAALIGPATADAVAEIFDNPARYLARRASAANRAPPS